MSGGIYGLYSSLKMIRQSLLYIYMVFPKIFGIYKVNTSFYQFPSKKVGKRSERFLQRTLVVEAPYHKL